MCDNRDFSRTRSDSRIDFQTATSNRAEYANLQNTQSKRNQSLSTTLGLVNLGDLAQRMVGITEVAAVETSPWNLTHNQISTRVIEIMQQITQSNDPITKNTNVVDYLRKHKHWDEPEIFTDELVGSLP